MRQRGNHTATLREHPTPSLEILLEMTKNDHKRGCAFELGYVYLNSITHSTNTCQLSISQCFTHIKFVLYLNLEYNNSIEKNKGEIYEGINI